MMSYIYIVNKSYKRPKYFLFGHFVPKVFTLWFDWFKIGVVDNWSNKYSGNEDLKSKTGICT